MGAIVVGAGAGRRVGGVEKAFMAVAGRPLLCWSVEVFERAPEVDEICLVVAGSSVERAQGLVREWGWRKVSAVVAGGRERQDSVGAGLAPLLGCDWVLVHDAARPLVSEAMVRAGLDAARRHGAAVAATAVRDTLKRVPAGSEVVQETVDRAGLWAAQTPQAFRASLLRDAFRQAGDDAGRYTDDAALVAAMGHPVAVFPGAPENVKLTHPGGPPPGGDPAPGPPPAGSPPPRTPQPAPRSAGSQLGSSGAGLRAGTGYDLHRLVAGAAPDPGRGDRALPPGAGRPLGRGRPRPRRHRRPPGRLRPGGHRAALPARRPGLPGRPQPRPAARGGGPGHPGRVAGAQPGRHSGLRAAPPGTIPAWRCRAALAGTLEVPPSAVSVKAKTNEGLDAVGRGEAIAAQAILLIVAGAPPGMLQEENPGGAPEAQTEERKRAGAQYAADDPR